MRLLKVSGFILPFLCLVLTVYCLADTVHMRQVSGVVKYIDGQGKGIVVTADIGGKEFIVGAIIDNRTVISSRKEKLSIGDIREGDRVILRYLLENNDLYAKSIMKR